VTNPLEELHGARVLVTGGSGFIGSVLRRTLRAAGAHPRALDNLSAYDPHTLQLLGTGPDDPELVIGDVNDEPLVRRLVRESDFVVHAAAHSTVAGCAADPGLAFSANIAGTDTVLRAVAATASVRRFILLSTAQAYGSGDPAADPGQIRVFREDQPVRPMNLYADAKVWAEFHTRHLLAPADRDFAVLRPFSVYGPGQVPKPGAPSWVIAQFTMYAALGQELLLNNGGRQVRDFVHVSDVALAVALALSTGAADGRTLNVGTGRATSVRDVAALVQSHFPGTVTKVAPRPAQDPLGGRADTTLLTGALRWRPDVTVEQGLNEYVAWVHATPGAIPTWLRDETSASRITAWNLSSASQETS
jgi:UDP-glucose 4-epimerase/dTDP-L-rhamnose 4-epimerase